MSLLLACLPPGTKAARENPFPRMLPNRRSTMKLTTITLGVLLATVAVPAFAQMGYGAPPPQAPQIPANQQQTEEKAPAIKISPGAQHALVELKKAVDANDTASIPEKVEAAKAVAKTKEDKYIIGQLQL